MSFSRLWAQARTVVWLAVIAVLAVIAGVLIAILTVEDLLALTIVGAGIVLAILSKN